MVNIITNFNKDDCVYYALVKAKACCGRSHKVGVCTIAEGDGSKTHKTCSTKMHYCRYTKKEEDTDVHPT